MNNVFTTLNTKVTLMRTDAAHVYTDEKLMYKRAVPFHITVNLEVEPLEPKVLKQMTASGAISGARVVNEEKGLVAWVKIGSNERILGMARSGGIRYFGSIDSAAFALQQCGVREFVFDSTGWTSKRSIVRQGSLVDL